jgi:hypothetical protein
MEARRLDRVSPEDFLMTDQDLLTAAVEACNVAFDVQNAGDKFAVYYTVNLDRDVLAWLNENGATAERIAALAPWTIAGCTATSTRVTQATIGIGTGAKTQVLASVTYILAA